MNTQSKRVLRLGVNLDHIASLRQARFTPYPDLSEAICISEQAGADGITLHLREDRRHIQDEDLWRVRKVAKIPLNMEMAATSQMLAIAGQVKPHACCLVPEKREELTTEGGLDVLRHRSLITDICAALGDQGIRVSLFLEPDPKHLDAAAQMGAPIVELHTGAYANKTGSDRDTQLERIKVAARHAVSIGLEAHAGHGLDYENVRAIAEIPQIRELNIGHSIVSRALFVGLAEAVREMRTHMGIPG